MVALAPVRTEGSLATNNQGPDRYWPVGAFHFFTAMKTTRPARQRIKFSDVAIGQRFYDPISAEYFIKQSDRFAAMVTGLGDGTIPDEFEADDIVGIDV